MATMIRVKSDSSRRQWSLTDVCQPAGEWLVQMPGMRPFRFSADGSVEAYAKAVGNLDRLERDSSIPKSNRGRKPKAFTGGTQSVPSTPVVATPGGSNGNTMEPTRGKGGKATVNAQ